MSSFWRTSNPIANKKHQCIYCNKTIQVGESYIRETGIFEGDFNDYCLCERCEFLIDQFEERGEELADIFETLDSISYLCCSKCGSIKLDESTLSWDKSNCHCECASCGHEWVEDLSIEGIKKKLKLV